MSLDNDAICTKYSGTEEDNSQGSLEPDPSLRVSLYIFNRLLQMYESNTECYLKNCYLIKKSAYYFNLLGQSSNIFPTVVNFW